MKSYYSLCNIFFENSQRTMPALTEILNECLVRNFNYEKILGLPSLSLKHLLREINKLNNEVKKNKIKKNLKKGIF